MTPMPLTFRQAIPTDADLLTGICQRAKQSHGYDDAMMQIFLGDGDMVISAEAIERDEFMLASIGDRVVGFAHLMPVEKPETIYLEDLFVEPDVQGSGVGRSLFNWALVEGGNRGFRWLEWDSDPNASAFYLKMGGVQISEQGSTLFPGRTIPKFRRPTAAIPGTRVIRPANPASSDFTIDDVVLRNVIPADAGLLGDICRRAKASLGYSQTLLDLWAAQGDMQFDSNMIDSNTFVTASVRDTAAGFAQVGATDHFGALLLEDLFVDPAFQGCGIGRLLFDWAFAQALDRNCDWLIWESDPLSTDYYRALGAEQYGQELSTLIPSRMIPLYRIGTASHRD